MVSKNPVTKSVKDKKYQGTLHSMAELEQDGVLDGAADDNHVS